jgi:murein L,D-transpeptidase YafK
VPEGYYRASSLAYWSRFHLGLGVNYPNRSDRILGRKNFYGAKSPFMATAHRSAVWR